MFLRKPQSSSISPRFLLIRESFERDLLGICSRGRYGAFHQVWLDLDFICSKSAVSRFVCGFSGRDRSDRWARPVRPVSQGLNCPTGQTGPGHRSDRSVCAVLRFEKFLSLLLPLCDPGLLLRDSLSIATLADLGFEGLRCFWDIGRRFEFRRNFDRLPFTPPLWSPVSVLQLVSELG